MPSILLYTLHFTLFISGKARNEIFRREMRMAEIVRAQVTWELCARSGYVVHSCGHQRCRGCKRFRNFGTVCALQELHLTMCWRRIRQMGRAIPCALPSAFEDRHTIAIATLDVLSSARARAGTVVVRVLSRCVVVVFCSPFPSALGDRGPNAWGFGAVW